MLLSALVFAAVGLTVAMFATKNMMLGFPCLIFWALLGGYGYQESTTTWDLYYLFFFASMGMAIFTGYAAFTLRKRDIDAPKGDWLETGKFFDEGKRSSRRNGDGDGHAPAREEGEYIDEELSSRPSKRALALRARAEDRRSGGRRFPHWGEFK